MLLFSGRRRRFAGYVCLLAAAVLVLLARGQPRAQSPPDLADQYRIQVGDQLDIKFFYNSPLNEQVLVRPDGRISLQLIDEVLAVGMTPAELTKELVERYSVELRQPAVTVIVRAFGAQLVFVDGEVGRPGLVPIIGVTTVLQAIAQAGGLKPSARESEVLIIRRGESAPVTVSVNLKNARRDDLAQNITLAPFDIVFVPRSRVADVNAWVDQYIRQNIPIPFNLSYGAYP